MAVYLVSCDSDRNDPKMAEIHEGLLDRFDAIQVLTGTWLLNTEENIDEVDEKLQGVFPDTEPMVLVVIGGDFSMQGLGDEEMDWIGERFGASEGDDGQ